MFPSPSAAGASGRASSTAPRRSRWSPAAWSSTGPQTLRAATYMLESYRLDDVAQHFLGRGKKIAKGVDPVEEIRRMHREDRAALAEYNLEDCRLVLDIIDAADLLGFAIERQRLTGLPMDKAGGSVAAFDHLYLPRLHRAGYVAARRRRRARARDGAGRRGARERAGPLHATCSCSISARCTRASSAPGTSIRSAWSCRTRIASRASTARRSRASRRSCPACSPSSGSAAPRRATEGRAALSTAIKILMNSFYGVLGTPGCRFYEPRLAASITRRGHEVISRTRQWVEERGRKVIYGDTDSLFVLVGDGRQRGRGAPRSGRRRPAS